MAIVFLKKPSDLNNPDSIDSIILQTEAEVLGAIGGNEQVILAANSSGKVQVDQNIEGVVVRGNPIDFTFKASGNTVDILRSGVSIATLTIQGDEDGTQVVFADENGTAIASVAIVISARTDGFDLKLGGTDGVVLTSTAIIAQDAVNAVYVKALSDYQSAATNASATSAAAAQAALEFKNAPVVSADNMTSVLALAKSAFDKAEQAASDAVSVKMAAESLLAAANASGDEAKITTATSNLSKATTDLSTANTQASSAEGFVDQVVASAIKTLTTAINAEAANVDTNADAIAKVAADLATLSTAVDTKDAAQTAALEAAEAALTTAIEKVAADLASEATARTSGDKTNADAIAKVAADLATLSTAVNTKDVAQTSALNAAKASLTTAIEKVAADLASEATARSTGDATNSDAIAKVAADLATLSTAVDTKDAAQTAALEAAEATLTTAIEKVAADLASEATARSTGDETNADAIAKVAADLATLSTAVDTKDAAQTAAFEAAEAALTTAIEKVAADLALEATARTSGDKTNADAIAKVAADLATLSTAVDTKDAAQTTALNAAKTALTTAIEKVSADLALEATARSTGDATNADAIAKVAADLATLTTAVDTKDAAQTSALNAAKASLTTAIEKVAADLASEATARTSGDKTNADAIAKVAADLATLSTAVDTKDAAQTAALEAAEAALTTAIEKVAADLASEATARTSGDKTNADAIAKVAADLATLSTAVDTKDAAQTAALEAAEAALTTAIEKVAADLASEATARSTGDATNADGIAANVTAIGDLQDALDALSDVVDENDAAIMTIIGAPASGEGDTAVPASGLYKTIADSVAAAVTSLTAQIDAVAADVETNTGDIADNAAAIGGLQDALDALSDVVDENDAAIMTIIGAPASGEGETAVEASGLYGVIADAVAAAVTNLEGQINTVAANVSTNTGDIADNAAAIGGLQDALDALSGVVDQNDADIMEIIGAVGSDTTESTGLFALIEDTVNAMADSLATQIGTLINDAVEGQAPSTDSIAGLKAALESLASIVGDTNSGLVMELNSLETQVTELGSALTAGYTAAKAAYDAAVAAASTSKTAADTAKTAYETARDAVTTADNKATAAATAVEKANDFYAAAIKAKTDADNLVAKANTVTIAAAQTPTTADDTALTNLTIDNKTIAEQAAAAQNDAADAVIMANSNVNAATIVLSNATLDASNQVIVTFIDYSSAAAATTSDISAAQTAKNAYDAALVTFDNAMTLNNANALKTAATNFNTAAVKAATTAQAAVDKATASAASAQTTSSTADDDIAATNVTTATTAKNTADGLKDIAAANLAYATAVANVPEVMALAGVGTYETGFSVTEGAVVTVTVTTGQTTTTADLEDKFTTATQNGVTTYTAKVDAFDGSETTIAVSAVMQATVGETTVSSVAATIADLDIDTTAPAAPNAALTTDSTGDSTVESYATDKITNSGAITAPTNTEQGATVEYRTKLGEGDFSAWGTTYSAPVTDGTKDGAYTVEVRQTDAAGNLSETQEITFTLDTDADTDNDLSIAIAEANDVTNLAESTAVAFTLAGIDTDAASVAVTFTDSATPTASTVTVDATKNATSGEWEVTTADLTGLKDGAVTATVTVTDTAGNTATAEDTLTLATTPAKVISVLLTAENEATYTQLNTGDVVTATVTMDSAVNVSGVPTLTLVIGTTEVQATYDATNSTATALKFNYTILAEQTDIDGISIKADGIVLPAATETLPATTITDANGNPATLTFTEVAANEGYIVDTTNPTAVATITALSADTEASGATNGTDFNTNTAAQTVSGTYDVALADGETIQVSVNGTNWVNAIATAGTTGGTWTTEENAITLVAGENTALSVRTIDAAGNVTSGTAKSYTLDTTAPTVTVSGIDISEDTGVSDSDFNTTGDEQTITATLSTGLGADETLWGSVNGGTSWINITNKVSSSGDKTAISWNGATLSGSSSIQLQVRDIAGNAGDTETQAYVLDTTAPTATVTLTTVEDNVGGITGDIFDANGAITDDTSLTLAGTVSAALGEGEAVVIYDTQDDGQGGSIITRLGDAIISGNANDGYTWTFTESRTVSESVLQDGYVANYSAVVEDLAGNQSTSTGNTFEATISTAPITSTAAITAIADDVDPVQSSITQSGAYTNDTIPVLSGTITLGSDGENGTLTALPGGQVVAVYDGTTRLGEATVTDATWTFTDVVYDENGDATTNPRLANGNTASYTVVIENTDVGTQGAVSEAFVLNIDDSVDAPSAPDLAAADDKGESDSDNITNQTTGLTLSGTGEVGATVKFYVRTDNGSGGFNYTAIQESNADITATVDEDGNYSADISLESALDTPYSIVSQQTDRAGNISDYSEVLSLTVDTTADAAPTALALATEDDTSGGTGTNSDGTTKNTENLTITGSGVEGSTVQLYSWVDGNDDLTIDEGELTALTGSSAKISNGSSFSIDLGRMAEGTYKLVAKQTDVAGNTSVASTAYTLVVDTTIATPTVSLASDTAGGDGTDSDFYTSNAGLTFSTTADDVSRQYQIGENTATNSYTPPTTDGTYTVTVIDTDTAGNTAEASITFTLDKSVQAPAINGLTTDTGASNSDKITKDMTLSIGGVEEGALVEYQVNSSGTWLSAQQYADLEDGTYSVVVRQTDKAGNVSGASDALAGIVKDTAAPAAVTFTITDNGTNTSDGVTSNEVVTISKADDVVMWEYTLNGTEETPTWVTGTGTQFSLGTTDASFAIGDIQVRGYDLAGNMTTASSNTMAYRLDKTAPMAADPAIKHYDSTGVLKEAGSEYVSGDYIEFLFNEQLSQVPTKTAGDTFGNLASFSLSDTSTSAFVQLKTGEAIDVNDTISLQVIDLVGLQSTIEFTLI